MAVAATAHHALVVLAAAGAAKKTAAPAASSGLSSLFLIGAVVLVAYFLLLRPGRNRARAQRDMHSSIGVGDEVVTNGGLVGRIVEDTGDGRLLLEVAPGIEVSILRQYVVQRVSGSPVEPDLAGSNDPDDAGDPDEDDAGDPDEDDAGDPDEDDAGDDDRLNGSRPGSGSGGEAGDR
jgi:preprotein translocase subunit YajC